MSPRGLRLVPLVLAHALAAGVELQSGFILDGEQDGCFIAPRVSYKYAPGDVFPNEPAQPHGMRLADSPAQCCAMCKALKNCSFWSLEGGGTAAKPTCYTWAGK